MTNNSLILNKLELQDVTGKRTKPAQAKVLLSLGIKPKVRPDGSLLVLHKQLTDAVMGTAKKEEFNPKFEALDG